MLRLLQFLFIGHIHKWETVETRRLENAAGATGTRVHLKCQHCGIWDYQDLIQSWHYDETSKSQRRSAIQHI